MSDMMAFPKTIDEFMEQYSIIDSDEVYTNGMKLVPVFRMKQWFNHVKNTGEYVPVVRCKDCKWCFLEGFVDARSVCEIHSELGIVDDNWYCADGKRREKDDG